MLLAKDRPFLLCYSQHPCPLQCTTDCLDRDLPKKGIFDGTVHLGGSIGLASLNKADSMVDIGRRKKVVDPRAVSRAYLADLASADTSFGMNERDGELLMGKMDDVVDSGIRECWRDGIGVKGVVQQMMMWHDLIKHYVMFSHHTM